MFVSFLIQPEGWMLKKKLREGSEASHFVLPGLTSVRHYKRLPRQGSHIPTVWLTAKCLPVINAKPIF
jgi:hypothetical protein